MDYMLADTAVVTSKGHINATFRIPGLTTVRSSVVNYDGDEDENEQRQRQKRTVTVASLDLDKELSWVCIPKGDPRVHMVAKIRNESEYTFLPGDCDVYVDQSYVAQISMPGVSPKEVFRCPLGLDPSIRVTYHPSSKYVATSGFLSKVTIHSCTQTISIHNTKSISVPNLKVVDHIPVSNDEDVTVKLLSPALAMPPPANSAYAFANVEKQDQVSDNVLAQWARQEESSAKADELGKDGKLEWICAMDSFGKVDLILKWELSTTGKGMIHGL